MNRIELVNQLQQYSSQYTEEQEFKFGFSDLLTHPNCYLRTHLPGHMTGSSWIVDESEKFTLLIHHKKLNKWLQPGGHADGNENIFEVALNEAREETGLHSLNPMPTIFDIDIHSIPTRDDFPEHTHYDIRFIIHADRTETLHPNHESNELRWFNIAELSSISNNESILRMCSKTADLLRKK